MKRTKTKYVTLHFPLLHIDSTYTEQHMKVIEEYNEFKKELFSDSLPDRLFHELQDVVQSYLTLLYVQARPTSLDEHEADARVMNLIEQLNQDHRKKIERYKAERGWV